MPCIYPPSTCPHQGRGPWRSGPEPPGPRGCSPGPARPDLVRVGRPTGHEPTGSRRRLRGEAPHQSSHVTESKRRAVVSLFGSAYQRSEARFRARVAGGGPLAHREPRALAEPPASGSAGLGFRVVGFRVFDLRVVGLRVFGIRVQDAESGGGSGGGGGQSRARPSRAQRRRRR